MYQNSKTYGARLTIETPVAERTAISWGGDLGREVTDMPLDIFDSAAYDASGGLVFKRTGTLIYMPELTTDTLGAFVQLQHRFSDLLAVEGGTISFDGWTFNAGATLTPVASQSFYASFS